MGKENKKEANSQSRDQFAGTGRTIQGPEGPECVSAVHPPASEELKAARDRMELHVNPNPRASRPGFQICLDHTNNRSFLFQTRRRAHGSP